MKDEADLKLLISAKKNKRINSRTKGNTFERKVAKILNDAFNTTEFCRTPGSGAFHTTHTLPEYLQIAGDLITPKDFPFLIECKRGYKFLVSDLLDDSSEFSKIISKLLGTCKNKLPLLIFQQDRKSILALTLNKNKFNSPKSIIFREYIIMDLIELIKEIKLQNLF